MASTSSMFWNIMWISEGARKLLLMVLGEPLKISDSYILVWIASDKKIQPSSQNQNFMKLQLTVCLSFSLRKTTERKPFTQKWYIALAEIWQKELKCGGQTWSRLSFAAEDTEAQKA